MFPNGQRRVPQWSERSRFSLFPPPPELHSPPPRPLLQPQAKTSSPQSLSPGNSTFNNTGSAWRLSTHCSSLNVQPTNDIDEETLDPLDDLDRPRASSNDSPPHDSTTTTQLATSSSSCSSLSSNDRNSKQIDSNAQTQSSKSLSSTTLPPPTHLFLPVDTTRRRRLQPPSHTSQLSPGIAVPISFNHNQSHQLSTDADPFQEPTGNFKLLSSKPDLHFQPPTVRPHYPASSPLWLEWQQLTYDLKRPSGVFYRVSRLLNLTEFSEGEFGPKNAGRRRRILQPQSGHFVGGSVNAIIGASGAGKSTLLECLAGRRRAGVGGQVRLHQDPAVFDQPLQVAYLPQTEALIPVLTVRETLMFASKLKNHHKLRYHAEHVQLVNALLDELRLHECADTRIQSISGGQRKRVAIASELISGPDVILLDEPTSGLDSCTAYLLVRLLRGLTCLAGGPRANRFRAPIVACSIHQPSAQLLTLFHNLYVLSSDGRCIYQGSPRTLLPHLSSLGLQCPAYQDPVAYITEIASGQLGVGPLECLAEAQAATQDFAMSGSLLKSTYDASNNDNGNRRLVNSLAAGLGLNCSSVTSTGSGQLFNGLPFDIQEHQNATVQQSVNEPTGDVTDESWDWPPLKTIESKHSLESPSHPFPSAHVMSSFGKSLSAAHPHPLHSSQLDHSNYQSYLQSTLPPTHLQSDRMSCVIRRMRNQSFPFLYHSSLLIRRTYLGTIREPKLTWLRITQTLFIGLLMSFLYDRPIGEPDGCIPQHWMSNGATMSTNQQQQLQAAWTTGNMSSIDHHQGSIAATTDHTTHENVAFVFFVTLFLVMSSMMPTVLTFPNEVRVLVEERANGYYACSSYYLAKVVADTPFVLFNALLFCCLVYPLTGQLMLWHRFVLFAGLANLVALIAHCIGMLFGTIYVHSVTSAVFMAPLSMSPVFLLSGFFGKIAALPLLLKPIAYLSYVRYIFECFLIALYGFNRCSRSESNLSSNHTVMTTTSLKQPSDAIIAAALESSHSSQESGNQQRSLMTQALPNELLRNLTAYLPPSSSDIWSKLQDTDLFNGFVANNDFQLDTNQTQSNSYSTLSQSSPPVTSTGNHIDNNHTNAAVAAVGRFQMARNNNNSTGSMVLDYYNLHDNLFWNNIAILTASFILLRVLAYLILVLKTNRFR